MPHDRRRPSPTLRRAAAPALAALGVALAGGDGRAQAPAVPEFGQPGARALRVVGDRTDGLDGPRDLAFHPNRPYELWTVNRPTDGTVLFFEPGTPRERVEVRNDKFRNHFMEEVSSIAFGDYGNFATCQESRNTYDRQYQANDFMGPTLWTGDLDIYARVNQTFDLDAALRSHLPLDPATTLGFSAPAGNPFACLPGAEPGRAFRPSDATQDRNPRLGSHIDMLHQSPNCMGIAHEAGNAYWVFDGHNGHLVRYDFAVDHGPGWDDHSDGIVRRYVEAEVTLVPDVPGHLALDAATGWLYAADPGGGRVIRLAIGSGELAERRQPRNEPLAELSTWRNARVEVFATGLRRPSGLALHGGRLFVGEAQGGAVVAFDTATGSQLGRLLTGARQLAGLEVGPDGRLYFVDTDAATLVRVDPDGAVPYVPPVVTPAPSFTPSAEPTSTPRPGAQTPTPPATATATASAAPTATASPTLSPTPAPPDTPAPPTATATPARWWAFVPRVVRDARR